MQWDNLVKVKVAQSCPTLCHPMDYTVCGILQARILEWVAFPFSRGSSQRTWRAGENAHSSAPTPWDSDSVGLGWSPGIFILTGTFWWFWWKISNPHLEKLLDTGRRKMLKKLLCECFGRLEKDVYSVKGRGIDGSNLEMLCYYLQKTEKPESEFTSYFICLQNDYFWFMVWILK